jgi:hypothetical protein
MVNYELKWHGHRYNEDMKESFCKFINGKKHILLSALLYVTKRWILMEKNKDFVEVAWAKVTYFLF